MEELKWMYRPFLAGLALVLSVLTYWGTGEIPPAWLLSLTITAWAWVFVSREKEKVNVQKAIRDAVDKNRG